VFTGNKKFNEEFFHNKCFVDKIFKLTQENLNHVRRYTHVRH